MLRESGAKLILAFSEVIKSITRARGKSLWGPASPRGEALYRCARPSGVPRGPATSTGSLASQRHPGKFPKVPGGSPVPSTPERREGLRACYWEGPSELPERLRELPRVPLRGEGSCGGGGAPRDCAGSGATVEGLTSRGGRNLRLPLRFGLRPQGPCRVVHTPHRGKGSLILSVGC